MAKRTTCPACKRHLPEDAQVCMKCGADLRPSKTLWLLAIGSAALALYAAWYGFAA